MNQTEKKDEQHDYEPKEWQEWRHYHRQHQHGAFWGIFFVFLGLIFLLNNFGILPWEVWRGIVRFWPLVFVFWGLDMIFGRSFIGRFIVVVVGLLIVAFILALSISLTNPIFADFMQSQLPWWKTVVSVSYNLPY